MTHEIEAAQIQFSILDHVPVGAFVLRHNFAILFWNSTLEDWTGISREKVIGSSIGEHFPHLQEPRYASRLQSIFEGGPPTIFSSQLHQFIIPVTLPNEQPQIQHGTVTAVTNPHGADFYALFVIQDVTDLTNRIHDYRTMRDQALVEINERQQAQQALQHRVEFENLITNLSTHFINLPSNQMNNGIEQALQTIGEFLNADRGHIFLFADGSKKIRKTYQWLKPQVAAEFEMHQEITLKQWPWFAAKVQRHEIINIPHIANLPAEAHLEQELLQTMGVKSSVNVPMVYRDSLAGFLGFDALLSQQTWSEEDIALLKIVGEIFVNALERKRTEARLQTYAANLERSNQELQNFAYIASHDLQEPLRKIQLFSNRLKTHQNEFDEQSLDYLERMFNASTRMQSLIQDLLEYSRLTTHGQPFTPVNLSKITSDVLSDLEVRIQESQAQIAVGLLPTIEADPMQMHQLLLNLIGNALKYYRPEEAPIVTVRAKIEDNVCRLSVADNGIGFDEKYSERIFRVFERLHGREKYEGTGIGLAICRKIIDRHGGEITVSSKPGEGSTFTVLLPVTQSGEI